MIRNAQSKFMLDEVDTKHWQLTVCTPAADVYARTTSGYRMHGGCLRATDAVSKIMCSMWSGRSRSGKGLTDEAILRCCCARRSNPVLVLRAQDAPDGRRTSSDTEEGCLKTHQTRECMNTATVWGVQFLVDLTQRSICYTGPADYGSTDFTVTRRQVSVQGVSASQATSHCHEVTRTAAAAVWQWIATGRTAVLCPPLCADAKNAKKAAQNTIQAHLFVYSTFNPIVGRWIRECRL